MKDTIKRKEKVPSSFSLTTCLSSSYYNNRKYINFSLLEKGCGRAENRTRDFRLTGKHFTIKLLAHNNNSTRLNYINLSL